MNFFGSEFLQMNSNWTTCITFSRVILARIERAKKVRFCGFIKVSRELIIKNFEIVRLTSNFLTMLDSVLKPIQNHCVSTINARRYNLN